MEWIKKIPTLKDFEMKETYREVNGEVSGELPEYYGLLPEWCVFESCDFPDGTWVLRIMPDTFRKFHFGFLEVKWRPAPGYSWSEMYVFELFIPEEFKQ